MSAPIAAFRIQLDVPVRHEQTVAVLPLGAKEAAGYVLDALPEDAFYDRRCWRVFTAASKCVDLNDFDARVATVSAETGLPIFLLERWYSRRLTYADTPRVPLKYGPVVRRVLDAADRRRRVLALLDELAELGAEPLPYSYLPDAEAA